ncbi:AAA family ATPase [Actinomadura formosensis]|uniref:AAA family ATPase n=1 Tax=Actinomadura formosensis TaxID=60706 RepID=UPI00082CBF8E|nr:AAA family ATPase [Actinomadura formosensis]
MRLISAHIRGYGRIVDSKVNLDAKVIAIVGPNEAGKTTLLKALAHVDADAAVPVPQRSRAADVTDETPITTFDYVLDDEDKDAVADLDLQQPPKRVSIARTASGQKLTVDVQPRPVKSIAPLQDAIAVLKFGQANEDLDDWIDPETVYADPNSDAARDYRTELQSIIDAVDGAIAEPGTGISDEAIKFAESLRSATLENTGADELRTALDTVVDWAKREGPGQVARDRIWHRSPDFIMFDEAGRSIQSTYAFDDALVADPPAALANLMGTASLDLKELLTFVRTDDVARRRTAIVQANKRMDAIFDEAWKQSRLAVHFEIDGNQLRIELIEDGNNVTVFDERSAGLRMFVALIAFLKTHGSDRPPILLIDEAENHLHIDAQADLVNMFVTQEHAVKVIYTTHSPACLPPDLGTGIRTVVPRKDNFQISDIKNSFWQGSAGYSPLMLAMGAAAVAFTPARNVVLAEGATEMILLPTLLRAATGESELPYQVAPGLSEAPKDFLPKLDLEAARVAYLVDSDDGGAALRSSLLRAGVPENVITDVGVAGIENVLDPDVYREAIKALLSECNPAVAADALPEIPVFATGKDESWASLSQAWIQSQNLKAPSKVAIANWLVENSRAIPSAAGKILLKSLHKQLLKVLDHEGS